MYGWWGKGEVMIWARRMWHRMHDRGWEILIMEVGMKGSGSHRYLVRRNWRCGSVSSNMAWVVVTRRRVMNSI